MRNPLLAPDNARSIRMLLCADKGALVAQSPRCAEPSMGSETSFESIETKEERSEGGESVCMRERARGREGEGKRLMRLRWLPKVVRCMKRDAAARDEADGDCDEREGEKQRCDVMCWSCGQASECKKSSRKEPIDWLNGLQSKAKSKTLSTAEHVVRVQLQPSRKVRLMLRLKLRKRASCMDSTH